MAERDGPIFVRSREDDKVPWSRKAARRSGMLKNYMDDAPADDDVYRVPDVAGNDRYPAAVLRTLAALSEPETTAVALAQSSLSELAELVEAALYLEAIPALEHVQREFATRLNGRSTEEIRVMLGAADDLIDEAREALLAEPAFMPPLAVAEQTAGSAAAAVPPPLRSQPSLSGLTVTEDAKEKALEKVEVATLLKLKGVNRSWCGVAQRVLCSRICCDEDGKICTLANITDVDAECLARVGRAGDVSAAGRLLPNLARLRGFGFEVDVAAIRGTDVSAALAALADEDDDDEDDDEDEGEDEDELFVRAVGGALDPYTTRLLPDEGGWPVEDKPPFELHLMAIACAASGEIRSVPVQRLRKDDAIGELDLKDCFVGPMGAKLLSLLLPRAASVVQLK